MQSIQTASDVWDFLHDCGLDIQPLHDQRAVSSDHPQTRFWLGDQRYAIPRTHIALIEPFVGCEPLPLAQPYVVGTTHIHDRTVIILDIRPLLLQARTLPKPNALLLVIQLLDTEVALLADSIEAEVSTADERR